jgi:hypothetical protein
MGEHTNLCIVGSMIVSHCERWKQRIQTNRCLCLVALGVACLMPVDEVAA